MSSSSRIATVKSLDFENVFFYVVSLSLNSAILGYHFMTLVSPMLEDLPN